MSAPVVGMLGAGQLGRMAALAAAPLGVRVHVYAPEPGPAMQVTDLATVAPYDDEAALAAFAAAVDVVTYEFENVPAATAAFLAARVPVRPGPRALEVAQHRVREKAFLNAHGVPTTAWRAVDSAAQARAAAEALGVPCVLKTAAGGYDGKGQAVLRHPADADAAWARLSRGQPLEAIVEAFVDFTCEASVVVARGLGGEVAAYDLVENRHRDHILHQTLAPAPNVPDAARVEAARLAAVIVDALDYVGVLGIELFITAAGGVLVNELAPRPHNSGHWTQDGAATSQFEQQIRAVLGWPLGPAHTRFPTVMTNLLGDDIDALPALLAEPDAHVHLYGKLEARPGRKMGHVNRVQPPVGSAG